MVLSKSIKCVICGDEFESRDRRKIYCGGSCKQEAHRRRHGLNIPEFLRPDAVNREKPRQKVIRAMPNPVFEERSDTIRNLEQRIESLRRHKEDNLRQEAKILSENDELLSSLTTAALSMSVVLGTVVIGYLISSNLRDKDKADKTKLIAVLIGLGLAAFLALTTHESTKGKNKQRKLDRIKRLKAECDRLDSEISQIESELAVRRVELCALPATISDQSNQSHNEVRTRPSASVMTARELQNMKFDLMELKNEYISLFGRPERGFAMALYGLPGQGKSTFATRLAYDLAVANGNGIYISAEEGFSQSLQEKSNSFQTDHLFFSNHKTLASIGAELQRNQYDIAVLDSIQQMGITPDELIKLREDNPRTSFIYILQARKDGEFKGNNRYAHDADIQVKLDSYIPQIEKTRFRKSL